MRTLRYSAQVRWVEFSASDGTLLQTPLWRRFTSTCQRKWKELRANLISLTTKFPEYWNQDSPSEFYWVSPTPATMRMVSAHPSQSNSRSNYVTFTVSNRTGMMIFLKRKRESGEKSYNDWKEQRKWCLRGVLRMRTLLKIQNSLYSAMDLPVLCAWPYTSDGSWAKMSLMFGWWEPKRD